MCYLEQVTLRLVMPSLGLARPLKNYLLIFFYYFGSEIYAASDIFSCRAACGLSQMMSMRYGTLPLVHGVGGLQVAVEPYNVHSG